MVTSLSQSPKCPVCSQFGKTVAEDLNLTPFCSARCKRLDLAKWLLEGYSLETNTWEDWDEALTQEPN
jgi:endogenous inhibitor of DNA gyrase (YacG/DUF329 family)